MTNSTTFADRRTVIQAAWLNDVNRATFVNAPLSVRDFGAVGDGVTDDTSAFLSAISAMTSGGTLLIPRGSYVVTSELDFSALSAFSIVGEHGSHERTGIGSQILGTVAGNLLKYMPSGTGNTFKIEGVLLANYSATAAAKIFHCENFVGSSIENCSIRCYGGYGIYARFNIFTFNIRNCTLVGKVHSFPGSIGIYTSSCTQIDGCDITLWGEGIRATGTQVSITGGRFEVNAIGMMLGKDENGLTSAMSRSYVAGNSFEANDTGVYVNSIKSTVISGIGMQGSANAPSGQSKLGVYVNAAAFCTFSGWNIFGEFNQAGIRLEGASGNSYDLLNSDATNTYGSNPKAWDVKTGLGTAGAVRIINCSYVARPNDLGFASWQRHGMSQYISQIDYINDNVEGKNLRGKNVALGNGVTTKAIAFTSSHSAGNASINTATATNTGGATLAAGTYYYIATIVTAHGEVSGSGEKTVTIGGSDNSTTVVFFSNTQDGFKRRIYRGTATGVYDGYFETTLDSNSNFVDIGQAFDGKKSPPSNGINDTSMIEPDANYAIVVTPSWLTTTRVTSKATTGFTVDFGTATSDALQTIDWVMVR